MENKKITAVILAGGKSSRMKRDKALLDFPEGKLIERIYGQLSPLFDEIIISVSKKNAKLFQNYKIVIDDIEDQGPLRGILSGLKASSNEAVFFIATDIPDVNLELLQEIIVFSKDFEIIVPKTSEKHYEPLFAIYNKNVIQKIEKLLNSGIRKIIELYPLCNTKFVITENKNKLTNINTPEEYEQFLRT